jgi:ribosomal protein L40E
MKENTDLVLLDYVNKLKKQRINREQEMNVWVGTILVLLLLITVFILFGFTGLTLVILPWIFYMWATEKDYPKKVCQACVEEIHIEATKCKHCGEPQPTE